MSTSAPRSVRHQIAGRDGPLFWYRVGDLVAVYPFTRSRMNRTTLGCYGHSARTKPMVTSWMWGVSFVGTDGLPSTWDATMRSFRAPDVSEVHDLKADALEQAREWVAKLATVTP